MAVARARGGTWSASQRLFKLMTPLSMAALARTYPLQRLCGWRRQAPGNTNTAAHVSSLFQPLVRRTRRSATQARSLSVGATYFSAPELNRISDFDVTSDISQHIQHAKFLPVKDGKCLVHKTEAGLYRPTYLDFSAARPLFGQHMENLIWLGDVDQTDRYVAVDVSAVNSFSEPPNSSMEPPRTIAAFLSGEDTLDAAVMATATGKGVWHQNFRFCSKCGTKTESRHAGSSRKCLNHECRKIYFPRVDPAAIVLITYKSDDIDYCLLGRQSRWATGRYSCLAGFVELGETLEDGVVREVFEETGVNVKRDSIKYVGSQPWPFPQSLMVGFHAEAETNGEGLPALQIAEDELEDAKWISRDTLLKTVEKQLQGHESAELHIPGQYALAWNIIKKWLDRDTN